jgi:uncharacterized protein YodC (DUF2158 family)
MAMEDQIRKWVVTRDGREKVVDEADVTREEFRSIALALAERNARDNITMHPDLVARQKTALGFTGPVPVSEGKNKGPFNLGDVVRLNSGGHLMTVVSDGCCGLVGVQYSHAGLIETEDFEPVTLEWVSPEEVAVIRLRANDIPF